MSRTPDWREQQEIRERIKQSKSTHQPTWRFLKPYFVAKFGLDSMIVSTEGIQDSLNFHRFLDLFGCTDGWAKMADGRMIPLAWRAQDEKDYKSFTPRLTAWDRPSELPKLLQALENETQRPMYHVQTYWSRWPQEGGVFLSAGLIKTKDLVMVSEVLMSKYPDRTRPPYQTNKKDGNLFLCVPWSFLKSRGADIFIAVQPKPQTVLF